MRNHNKLFLMFIAARLLAGCSERPQIGFSEGVIRYKLSLPYVKENLLANLYPKELVYEFDGEKTHSTIQAIADMGRTEFVTSNTSLTLDYFLKDFDSTYSMQLNKSLVSSMLRDFPTVKLQPTNETETICGYQCKKTIAHFTNDSLPSVVLLHTDKIRIKNPNWYTQFHEIDDVLLAYDVEQFGLRTRLEAVSVEFFDVDDARFNAPTGMRQISWQEMRPIMNSMLSRFKDESAGQTQ